MAVSDLSSLFTPKKPLHYNLTLSIYLYIQIILTHDTMKLYIRVLYKNTALPQSYHKTV